MIYFIREEASGQIKIGYANDPWVRLRNFQTASPFGVEIVALEEGGAGREAELHRQFATSLSRGEWFRPTPDLTDYMAALGDPERPADTRSLRTRAFWGGLSAAEVSRLVKISSPHLSDILNGKRRPSPELAMELQRATGRSAIEFVFGGMAAEALALHGVQPMERAA